MKTASRPIGVTIIAILEILAAIIMILLGIVFFALGPVFESFGLPVVGMIGNGVGIFLLVVGLIAVVIGWGLLTGKNWARWLVIIGSALGILLGVWGFIVDPSSASALIGVVPSLLFIYVIMRSDAKAFFTGFSTATAPLQGYMPAPPQMAPPAYPINPAAPTAGGTKYCINCGARIPASAVFCGNCGGKQT